MKVLCLLDGIEIYRSNLEWKLNQATQAIFSTCRTKYFDYILHASRQYKLINYIG